jgi:hypothetical protein
MPIAIVPDSSRAAAPACPSVQPDYSAEKKLGTCLKDAEAAQKNGSDEYTAAAYLEALKLAKLIYSAYSTQQDFKWTVSDSDAVVHCSRTVRALPALTSGSYLTQVCRLKRRSSSRLRNVGNSLPQR